LFVGALSLCASARCASAVRYYIRNNLSDMPSLQNSDLPSCQNVTITMTFSWEIVFSALVPPRPLYSTDEAFQGQFGWQLVSGGVRQRLAAAGHVAGFFEFQYAHSQIVMTQCEGTTYLYIGHLHSSTQKWFTYKELGPVCMSNTFTFNVTVVPAVARLYRYIYQGTKVALTTPTHHSLQSGTMVRCWRLSSFDIHYASQD